MHVPSEWLSVRVAVKVAVKPSGTRNSIRGYVTVSYGESMEGPVGFEPTTPGLKARESDVDRPL